MSNERFRCDYCGTLAELHHVQLRWRWVEDLGDAEVYTSALYCSDYCGKSAVSAAGSGRG